MRACASLTYGFDNTASGKVSFAGDEVFAADNNFTENDNRVAGEDNSVRPWIAENQNASQFLFFLLLETSCCGYRPVKHKTGRNFKGLILRKIPGPPRFRATRPSVRQWEHNSLLRFNERSWSWRVTTTRPVFARALTLRGLASEWNCPPEIPFRDRPLVIDFGRSLRGGRVPFPSLVWNADRLNLVHFGSAWLCELLLPLPVA